MSKDIDTSDLGSLSDDELRFLRDRGQLTVEQEQEYLSKDLDEATLNGESAPVPAGGGSVPASAVTQLPSGNDNYDTMHKKELKETAEDRGLSSAGTVPELIQRLRQYDVDAAGGDSE